MCVKIEKVLEVIERSFNEQYSLNDLCRIAGISKYYFIRTFKFTTNKTPMAYLKEVRMKNAEILLKTSDLSIKEVAFKVGINDLSHFVRDFKLIYGIYPMQYKQINKVKEV